MSIDGRGTINCGSCMVLQTGAGHGGSIWTVKLSFSFHSHMLAPSMIARRGHVATVSSFERPVERLKDPQGVTLNRETYEQQAGENKPAKRPLAAVSHFVHHLSRATAYLCIRWVMNG